ncbi:MAG TPA: Eco57I restriction-modification methylase domain-containing protein [Candidatus Cloacimonadota bacterium]|nr:Eco57I restriction-modification methylase domain-containing protein [Candidatus Cloacimonadota bacterium]
MDNISSQLAISIEAQRLVHTHNVSDVHKSNLGQYLTPYSIANFMASMLPIHEGAISLLDPGSGVGTLASAFLERCYSLNPRQQVNCDCYEIDEGCIPTLQHNMEFFKKHYSLNYNIIPEDYLGSASDSYFNFDGTKYTHVIMNPPYKKISNSSLPRKLLESIGVKAVNLYAAFVSMAIEQLNDDGYLVAILPRSFCNGVYYESFRKHMLKNTVIRRIHLFESRKSVFKEDSVLQENIIIMLQKNREPTTVTVSYSKDKTIDSIVTESFFYRNIVDTESRSLIINIPTSNNSKPTSKYIRTLDEIQLKVSTGPIVDFRHKDNICSQSDKGIPLVYPFHIDNFTVSWPKVNPKKPDYFLADSSVAKYLYPKGFYIVVKRFSSKEENRRIVAAILNPNDYIHNQYAFENHLNVYHSGGHGLDEDIAWGLLCYLNIQAVDIDFRLFSGHTQVNAFDLRQLRYPDQKTLIRLGQAIRDNALSYSNFESTLQEF